MSTQPEQPYFNPIDHVDLGDIELIEIPKQAELIAFSRRLAAFTMEHIGDLKAESMIELSIDSEGLEGEDKPESVRIYQISQNGKTEQKVIIFADENSPAAISIGMEVDQVAGDNKEELGVPDIQYYGGLDKAVRTLNPHIIDSLVESDNPINKALGTILSSAATIVGRIKAAQDSGIDQHTDYTGPRLDLNTPLEVDSAEFRAFQEGIPQSKLDGILHSQTEVETMKDAIITILTTHPASHSVVDGRLPMAQGKIERLGLTHLSVSANNPALEKAILEPYVQSGLARTELRYDTPSHEFEASILQGKEEAPVITILDKHNRKQAVEAKLARGDYSSDESYTSAGSSIGIHIRLPDDRSRALFEVIQQGLPEDPTRGKIAIIDAIMKHISDTKAQPDS